MPPIPTRQVFRLFSRLFVNTHFIIGKIKIIRFLDVTLTQIHVLTTQMFLRIFNVFLESTIDFIISAKSYVIHSSLTIEVLQLQ